MRPTSFGLCTFGQNFNKPIMTFGGERNVKEVQWLPESLTGSVKLGSFSRNCTTQYANCG
jgi:hypothetical protein